MKQQLILATGLILLNGVAFAQTQVNAEEVVAKINRGEAINYQNARISGDLDLTHLAKQTIEFQDKEKMSDTIFVNTVGVPLNFTNCTFSGKVIGYFNPDNDKKVETVRPSKIYNTNFDKDVAFMNCTFEKEVNFKYTEFKAKASFSASKFKDLAFFKYTDFAKAPDFSQVQFKALSFKYVKFPGNASFAGARFTGDTDFKYAEFGEGADFQKAKFDGFANFKYAKLDKPNLKGAMFSHSGDFKYTTVNNRKMALTALSDNSRLQ
jgi:uncharacterized protein YjbI with pentapeptide repeats